MAKKVLPKSIDDIEYIPFVGRDIDLNTKGKPSTYLRNVVIPYYRKVIKGLDVEIAELKKSKRELLARKNRQIQARRWLKYKSNQVRYAVQQRKVREQSVEVAAKKVRRSALEKGDLLSTLYFLPTMMKIAKESNIKFNDFMYIVYTSNFKYLSIADYKSFFGDTFSMTSLNNCRRLEYIDVLKTSLNQYYLSYKGKNIMKRIKEESEKLKEQNGI
jgi:hypothetical protein